MIFEGTEGLPAQIARRLQQRQLIDAERAVYRWSAGATAFSRQRLLLASEVIPAQEETLAQSARWAAERRENTLPAWRWR